MSERASTIATWLTILAMIVGGGIWVGSQASELQTTKNDVMKNTQQIDKIRDQVPADIAGMKSKIEGIEGDVQDIKRSQAEILKELRKK